CSYLGFANGTHQSCCIDQYHDLPDVGIK
ncbi:hypothetical protein VEx25_B0318, partial [Vibrio antiquarius]